ADVEHDIEDGANAGVSGTPAFFINGVLLSGAVPFENFKDIIDEEVARVGTRTFIRDKGVMP
ncbi:MAG TPA: thioredoxin domain-containing protein, partial [Bdellovibrionota bacterium]|nr:thioredoxin domain-containing protein [Bdellovibrionota bacterium]